MRKGMRKGKRKRSERRTVNEKRYTSKKFAHVKLHIRESVFQSLWEAASVILQYRMNSLLKKKKTKDYKK